MRKTMFVLGLCLALILGGAAKCDKEGQPAPKPKASNIPTPTGANRANVAKLCDFFYTRPHEVLLTSGAEGNVSVYRELSGVPGELGEVARQYYAGEALNPASITADHRKVLDGKYRAVIDHCTAAGWTAP